jgi:hypothetical protein
MKNTVWQTPSGIAVTTYTAEPLPLTFDGDGQAIESPPLTSAQQAAADQASGVIPGDWVALAHDHAVTRQQFEAIEALEWVDGELVLNAAAAFARLASRAEVAAQAVLDAGALAWGFDSLVSAASYVTSKNAQRRADAIALVDWRDDLWDASAAIKSSVIAGTQSAPASIAAFLAALPAQPARTVA